MSGDASDPSSRTTSPTLAGLEVLKLLASLGIVAFHLHSPGERIGYAGLPVFMLLTTALALRAAQGRSRSEFGFGRVRRLLVPWLVWSGLYALLQCHVCSLQGQPLWSWPRWSMLLVGTFPHLWYLPFAAVLSLAIGLFAAGRSPRGARASWWPAAGGLLMIPISSQLMVSNLPEPLPQWSFVLPAALFGLAFAKQPPGELTHARTLTILTGATWLVCLGCWEFGWLDLAVPYAVGIAAAALAWCLPGRASRPLLACTRTSFGIYVLHPFVALATGLFQQQTGVGLSPAMTLAAVFLVSMALTALLRLTPARAIL